MARPICLRLFAHAERRPASRAAWTAGSNMAAKIAIITITTINSTNVKPEERRERMALSPTFSSDRLWVKGMTNRWTSTSHKAFILLAVASCHKLISICEAQRHNGPSKRKAPVRYRHGSVLGRRYAIGVPEIAEEKRIAVTTDIVGRYAFAAR